MKRIISLFLALTICTAMIACGTEEQKAEASNQDVEGEEIMVSEEIIREDEEIINGILSCFLPLTEIPRQSHHEELISEYLYKWAEERGFNPIKDSANNILFDVPGTEGMENAPLTILQGHMDMVVAVKEGKQFNPQKDGITVINDGKTLTADGTSLGADDGMGIATALYIVDNNKSHGPLRVIFTTDEEDGMTGAFNLTSEDVEGAKYVLNLDSEETDKVTNSAAAGVFGSFVLTAETTEPKNNLAYSITIQGLKSGHSGLEINMGRTNGIIALAEILHELQSSGIDMEISSIQGGSAANAIPGKATAVIVIKADDEELLKSGLSEITDALRESTKNTEPDLNVILEECEVPDRVLGQKSKENAIGFITSIQDGVYSMSESVEGLVQSSSNLGLISIASDGSESMVKTLIRSSNPEELELMVNIQKELAISYGFTPEMTLTSDAWPVNPNSKLVHMVTDAYKKETGKEMMVAQVHAGLETGSFSKLNPDMDIVSIGFDIVSPHTISETCYLETIPASVRMLERVLSEIGNETA